MLRVGEDETHYVGTTARISSGSRRLGIYIDIDIRVVYNGKAYPPTNPTDAHLRPLQSVHPVHNLSIRSRTYSPTQRRLHVRAHQSVSRISALSVRFTEARDPTFGETDADVDLVGLEGRDHVAGAGGEGDEGTL